MVEGVEMKPIGDGGAYAPPPHTHTHTHTQPAGRRRRRAAARGLHQVHDAGRGQVGIVGVVSRRARTQRKPREKRKKRKKKHSHTLPPSPHTLPRRELLRGPLFYVVVLQAVTLAWWRASPVPLLVVAAMCGGDGVADIVGRNVPSPRLPWNRAKSVAGSLAMAVTTAAMATGFMAAFTACGLFRVDPTAAVGAAVAVAVAATLVESLPLRWLDDNLSVPAVAAGLGWWLFQPV